MENKLDDLIEFYYPGIDGLDKVDLKAILVSWGTKCFEAGKSRDFGSYIDFEKPKPKVLYENEVGEVFTEFDLSHNIPVFYIEDGELVEERFKNIHGEYTSTIASTGIFKSKESLLDYMVTVNYHYGKNKSLD